MVNRRKLLYVYRAQKKVGEKKPIRTVIQRKTQQCKISNEIYNTTQTDPLMFSSEIVGDSNAMFSRIACGEVRVDLDSFQMLLFCKFCAAHFEKMQFFTNHIKKVHKDELRDWSNDDPISVENTELTGRGSNIENLLDQRNEEMIVHLIHYYRDQPVLWDPTHEHHLNLRQRQSAMRDILAKVNRDVPHVNFTYNNLSTLLSKIFEVYHEESQRRQRGILENFEFIPNCWFFGEMQFLAKKENLMFTEKKGNYEEILSTLSLDLKDSHKYNFIMDLIHLYEQQHSLWDINHSEYKGKLRNQSDLMELVAIFKINQPEIACINRIRQWLTALNDWFSQEEYQRLESQKQANTFQSKNPHLYTSLEFLQGHVPPFRCSICQEIYNREDAYMRHISNKTSSCADRLNGRVNFCNYCGKRFLKSHYLRIHMRIHTDERPFTCNTCGKTFRYCNTLSRHKRFHTKIKPFKCEQCQKCYYTQAQLRLHQKSHFDIRDKVCDICGKTFTQAKYLHQHQTVHIMAANFQCETCNRSFKTSSHMRVHRKRCKELQALSNKDQENIVNTSAPADTAHGLEFDYIEQLFDSN